MSRIILVRQLAALFIISQALLTGCAQGNSAAEPDMGLDCAMMPHVIQVFRSLHVLQNLSTDELEKRTIDTYVNRLDISKTVLLAADINEYKKDLKGVFKGIGEKCEPILEVHKKFAKRMEQASKIAIDFVQAPKYALDESAELVLNPKKRNYSKSSDELATINQKYVHFQISNYLSTGMKLAEAKKKLVHRYELNVDRIKKVKTEEIYEIFLDSLANSMDAHSGFLGRDSQEEFEIQMRLSLEGIGASLQWDDGYTTVAAIIPGGAADRHGELQVSDKIIAVAQGDGPFESVIDMPLREVIKLIRGKRNTKVRLTVLRQEAKDTKNIQISLLRDKINLEDESARLVFQDVKRDGKLKKIAILELPSFYGDLSTRSRSCSDDVRKLLIKAKQSKADALVLDLSKNGGGLLPEAVSIAGFFVKEGAVVATQNSRSQVELLADKDDKTIWSGPLVVHTSRLSASASEIVAGALKDWKRAVIVGNDHTFGKGSVQAVINLPSKIGAVKVTQGMFFIPRGQSTQYQGVESDIRIPSKFEIDDFGERSLDYSLPPKVITSFIADSINDRGTDHWAPIEDALIKKLATLSSQRVSVNEDFAKIKKELDEQKAQNGVIKVSQSKNDADLDGSPDEEKPKTPKKGKGIRSRASNTEDYLKEAALHEAIEVAADLVTVK